MTMFRGFAWIVMASLMLAGCASMSGPDKRDLILGAWQAEFQGENMTLVYSDDEISVQQFGISFPYEWVDEDHIRLNALGQEVTSRVEFEDPDTMVQVSGDNRQVMTRVDQGGS